jgi:hypothetical protein
MTDGQADAIVTIEEEIRCLLDAGWAWDGDKLVHPTHKEIWRMYQRVDCRSITARSEQFESEIREAVFRARQQGRCDGRCAWSWLKRRWSALRQPTPRCPRFGRRTSETGASHSASCDL